MNGILFICKEGLVKVCINVPGGGGGGGGGGGTLIFLYTRRLGSFFWVQNFEFQYFWGFQKNEYFLGYEDLVDILLGSSQNWTKIRGHFYAF